MSAQWIRALNGEGIQAFTTYLDSLREYPGAPPPRGLLTDPATSMDIQASVSIEEAAFKTRYHLAQHLNDRLQSASVRIREPDEGLWAWLSLFFFDQVCPRGEMGKRKPGRDYRHIPSREFRHRYRHLIYGACIACEMHGEYSKVLLWSPPHRETAIFHEISGRPLLWTSRGIVQAAYHLYFDTGRGHLKRGFQASRREAGNLQRFLNLLQQLDVTYDLSMLDGEEVLSLLPEEFDPWRGVEETTPRLPY